MQINDFADLHIALRCDRCLQVRNRISIPSTVRVSGTNFPLNISYYLVLHHYNRFLCDNCYGHLQSLFDNYYFPVDNLDRLLFSPIINTYDRARITSNHPVPAINYPQYREDLIEEIRMLRPIIDDVSITRRPLQQIVAPTEVTPAFDVVKDILGRCEITSDSCSTYTIDFTGCCYPSPAYIASDDTDSERMSTYTTKSKQLLAWKRRENRNQIYDLRRSIATTNISIENHVPIRTVQPALNRSEEQFDLKRHTYTSLKLEDISSVSDTSSTVTVPKNFESINVECRTLTMTDFVGDAVPPNSKVVDWIIDNQHLELESVHSYALGPSKIQSENSLVNRSHASVELLYQCRRSDDYDTDSTLDPICERLMNQPPNPNRSMSGSAASGLTERIISYNDSPQSFSSFPLGQSEDEIYDMDSDFSNFESLNYASIATKAQLQNEIVSIANSIPSTSLSKTGNESDVAGTNTIRFSDTSSNWTHVLGQHEDCDFFTTDSPNSSDRTDSRRVDTNTSTDEI